MSKASAIKLLRTYKAIIWDCNGTIIDDVHIALVSINRLLKRRNLLKVKKIRHQTIFRFPVEEYYRDLGFDLERENFEDIAEEYCREYNLELTKRGRLVPGIIDVLQSLKGLRMALLSAASQEDLDVWGQHLKFAPYFEFIFGLCSRLGEGKLQRGRELITALSMPPADIILVGDTDHDLHVGKQLGVDVLLVATGHQSFEKLKAIHPQVLRSLV